MQLHMQLTAELRNTTSEILSKSSDTLDLAIVTKENLEEQLNAQRKLEQGMENLAS